MGKILDLVLEKFLEWDKNHRDEPGVILLTESRIKDLQFETGDTSGKSTHVYGLRIIKDVNISFMVKAEDRRIGIGDWDTPK